MGILSKLKSLFKLPVCEDPAVMEQQKRLYPAVFIEQTSAMLLGLVNVAVTGTISSAALAGSIQGRGVAAATLTIPRRYSHSPVELMHMNDVMAMLELLGKFITE